MRFSKISALALALVLTIPVAAQAAEGQPAHAFGLGLEIGSPTGLAAKYYLGRSSGRGGMMALQAGLGVVEGWGPDGFHLHFDVVWHPAVIASVPAFTMPFYFGVGGRLLDWNDDYCWRENGQVYCSGYDGDTAIGVRVPFGILLDFHEVPIDVFLELALVLDLLYIDSDDRFERDHDLLSLNGVLGVRYYF